MTANIEQLRAVAEGLAVATESDPELDYIIARMFGLDGGPFIEGDDEAPEFTASIDAALALVERLLPGWEDFTGFNPSHGGGSGCAYCTLERDARARWGAVAPTRPLAILRALVAALLAQAESTQ